MEWDMTGEALSSTFPINDRGFTSFDRPQQAEGIFSLDNIISMDDSSITLSVLDLDILKGVELKVSSCLSNLDGGEIAPDWNFPRYAPPTQFPSHS